MSSAEEIYNKLQDDIKRLTRDRDKAVGALEQIQATLKAEFDCDNIAEAKALLANLEAQEARLEIAFTKAVKKFEMEFGDELK